MLEALDVVIADTQVQSKPANDTNVLEGSGSVIAAAEAVVVNDDASISDAISVIDCIFIGIPVCM